MAKVTLSIAEAKTELELKNKVVETLTAAGVEVPAEIRERIERLLKIINGNASANVCSVLNDGISKQLVFGDDEDTNAYLNKLLSAMGNGVKVEIKPLKNEQGETTGITFEAPNSTRAASSGGTSGGGTKTPTAYNNYKVTVIADLPEYAEKVKTFNTAAGAVGFILNNGKNPLNKGAEFGKGDSAVRVLEKKLETMEEFSKYFTVEKSYVKVEKKTESPVETETAE